jgi:hypothetical protein
VVSAAEVSGQTLEYNTVVGPFTLSAANTVANAVAFDFVNPRGMYYARDDGKLGEIQANLVVELRKIDQYGNPLGSWYNPQEPHYLKVLVMEYDSKGNLILNTSDGMTTEIVLRGHTASVVRTSIKYAVDPGRYQARVTRIDQPNTSDRAGDEVVWAGCRAYLEDDNFYGDCTLLAVRMRATGQLSGMTARKIKVVATRKLPRWTGTAWTSPEATTSPAWALAYCCKQIGLSDSEIDLASLLTLAATWGTRGDECNGRVDNFLGFWDALTKIGSAGRCKPYMQGGVVHFFRDAAATVPVALFSQRNIVKGSFAVDYLMPTTDTADAVNASYFDDATWAAYTVKAALPDSTAERPADVELSFITDRDQAYREAMYQAACNRYRRKIIKFQTEMEGFIPSFGDLVVIQHDMPGWGQSGEVVAYESATKTLSCSEPVTTGSGTLQIGLRRPDGSFQGPITVTIDAEDNAVLHLATAPDFTLAIDGKGERTHYVFGWSETWAQKARVLRVVPKSLTAVEIEAVNESDNVHTADVGIFTPERPTSQLPGTVSTPAVTGLAATALPADPTTMILSWKSAAGADHYLVEISNGNAGPWEPVGDCRTNSYRLKAVYGPETWARVAPVGLNQGPWVTVQYSPNQAYLWNNTASALTATLQDGQINLSWDNSTDWTVAGYEIRVGASWDAGEVIARQVAGNTMAWQPPDDGDKTFWLKAIDAFGTYATTPASVVFSGTVPAPTTLTAISGDTGIYLSWGIPVDYVPRYTEIWRATSNNRAAAILIATANGTTYTDVPHQDGEYYYWVRFVGKLGFAGAYNATSGVYGTAGGDYTAPAAATNLVATGGLGVIFLTWTNPASTNLDLVEIYRHTSNSRAAATLIGTSKVAMYSDPVEPGSTYYYWVRTRSKVGVVGPYNATSGVLGQSSVLADTIIDALQGELDESVLTEDLRARIDLVDAEGTGLVTQIADLTAIYGDTASAAQSALDAIAAAADAEVARDQAVTAKTSAETAAGNASTYAFNASESATSAAGSASTATTQAGTATTAANNAGASANAASTHASNAASYADDAENYSVAASGSATNAASSAGNALTYAGQAAQSATDADGYATSAAQSLLAIEAIGGNAASLFRETFDSDSTSLWTSTSGSGEISIETTTGAVMGGKILRIGNNSGNDQRALIHTKRIPLDTTRVYRMRVIARQTAGTGRAYFGWAGFDEEGTAYVNTSGVDASTGQHYHTASNVDIPTSWTTYTGFSQGAAATGESTPGTEADPSKFHSAVRYISPMVIVNYSGVAGITEIDSIVVEDVTDAVENSAAITTLATTTASADIANASQISTVQARLDSGDFAAVKVESSTNASDVTGIQAKYAVKVQANGYVTGYGLVVDANTATPTSEFAIVADKFSIAPVSTDHTASDGSPFFYRTTSTTINGVSVPAGAYMKAAFIHDASITTAKIQDLAVSTAKIANLAVTDAKIETLAVSKLTAGSITSQDITLAGTSAIHSTGCSYGGTGVFLGYSGSAYKFSVGNATTYLRWDGSALSFTGDLNTSGVMKCTGPGYASDGLSTACIVGHNTGLQNGVVGRANLAYGVVGRTDGASFAGVLGSSSVNGTTGVLGNVTGTGSLAVDAHCLGANSVGLYARGFGTDSKAIYATTGSNSKVALETYGKIECSSTARISGQSNPTSGAGLELLYGSVGQSYALSYDRDVGAYKPLILAAKNVGIGHSMVTFGTNAQYVIAIANGIAPTTSPANTGQLYVESGALKYRGSSGTVTTIAPA